MTLRLLPLLFLSLLPLSLLAQEQPALQAPDGSLYQGPLVNGLREGQGRATWPNGNSYEGGFSGGLFSGQGRFTLANGDVYEGGFRQGMTNGQGKQNWTNGSSYEGDFKNGRPHGKGRYLNSAGVIHEGEFADNDFTGHGSIRWPNGSHYEGHVEKWQMNGQGIFTTADGTRHEGAFIDGTLNGFARIYKAEKLHYEGNLDNWQPNGQGTMHFANGNRDEGTFSKGTLNGPGRLYRGGKLFYEGSLQHGRPEGEGTLYLPNGDQYQGGFKQGRYHGQGTLTYAKPQADGQLREEGNWTFGQLDRPEEKKRQRQKIEEALYRQRELLDAELATLAPAASQKPQGNLFFLGMAGDGSQEVFRREISFVRQQFEQDFNAKGRAVSLVNSRNTTSSLPMATRTSLRDALNRIAQVMDKERDILFLYVTSHGTQQHELVLSPPGIDIANLTPDELASYLRDSGIRWKVVVISACYAGGFLKPLEDDGTLVIVAARHDRRSFGCADENDFTYFGRAFFSESLPASTSFQQAFQKASQLVHEWESRDASGEKVDSSRNKDEGDNFSLPQIQVGKSIEKHLEIWWPHRRK